MDGRFGLIVFHPYDQTLNLPPAAEMDNIPPIATAIGTRRRLCGCHSAKFGDQFGCVIHSIAVIKIEWGAHIELLPANVFLISDDLELILIQTKPFRSPGELGEKNVSLRGG